MRSLQAIHIRQAEMRTGRHFRPSSQGRHAQFHRVHLIALTKARTKGAEIAASSSTGKIPCHCSSIVMRTMLDFSLVKKPSRRKWKSAALVR